MSWIKDEAKKNIEKESKESARNELIARSNFWGRLLRQVDADVKEINEDDHWRKKLGESTVRVSETSGRAGYLVMAGDLDVLVFIENKGDYLVIEREFTNSPIEDQFLLCEKLSVDTSGNNVILISQNARRFVVPEEASQYILKAVIESLKIARPQGNLRG